ncbi:hypothetical protein Hanom_Chr12g01148911 [Helianthus anomalus]
MMSSVFKLGTESVPKMLKVGTDSVPKKYPVSEPGTNCSSLIQTPNFVTYDWIWCPWLVFRKTYMHISNIDRQINERGLHSLQK